MINEDPLDREGTERLKSFKENICPNFRENANVIFKIWWAIQFPAKIVLAITTPSPRAPYFLTLLVSIIWIGIISYLLAWFLTVVGYNLGVPDAIMGITVLAIGTSIPEVVSSYIICRKGKVRFLIFRHVSLFSYNLFSYGLFSVDSSYRSMQHHLQINNNQFRNGLNGHVQRHRCKHI